MESHLKQARGLVEPLVLSIVVGVIAGSGSALFLHGLDWATSTRGAHGWLLWLLPVAGLAIGSVYHYGGGRAGAGTNLILRELHSPTAALPRRMAPLILSTSIATHLFGGSAGREGVAVQIASGVSDQLSRICKTLDRSLLLTVAIAAGFGAVFGTPVAGAIFAIEMPAIGAMRSVRTRGPWCLVAALVGDQMTRALGIDHDLVPPFTGVALSVSNLARAALLGAACGLAALAFILATKAVRATAARVSWSPLRPVIGGCMVIALVTVAGTRDYLGLSVPLGVAAVSGAAMGFSRWIWKLVFTSVTLGTGFQGGEVTPLFVIGATLASAGAGVVGLPAAAAAMIGFVCVFGAASNTPIACTIVAVEIFGGAIAPFAALALVVATAVSTRRSIYAAQCLGAPSGTVTT